MAREKLTGVYVPMITPFNADESINFNGIKEVTDFLVTNGMTGVIPSGSTGEGIAMAKDEQIAVNRATIKAAAGRMKVVASTGSYRTKDVVEKSVAAEADGADGVMVVTPWYMAANENELLKHYETIHKAINIPVMLYHNPYYTSCLLSDEFMAKLYNEGFIDAVKERQADVFRQQDLRYLTDDGFGILYGYDVAPVESLSCWADGWVCGTGNLFPKENMELFRLAHGRKMEEAMKFHFEKIRPYLKLFVTPTADGMPAPWLSILKAGLKLRGVDAGYCRKPAFSELPAEVMASLRVVLKEYGYLA